MNLHRILFDSETLCSVVVRSRLTTPATECSVSGCDVLEAKLVTFSATYAMKAHNYIHKELWGYIVGYVISYCTCNRCCYLL